MACGEPHTAHFHSCRAEDGSGQYCRIRMGGVSGIIRCIVESETYIPKIEHDMMMIAVPSRWANVHVIEWIDAAYLHQIQYMRIAKGHGQLSTARSICCYETHETN